VPAHHGLFRGLFDDASLFPPASLPMADAVTGHFRHQAAWYREMSGPFVCPDAKISQLAAIMTTAGVMQLDLALVLPGGSAALPASVDAVLAEPRLRLRAVEVPVAQQPAASAGAGTEPAGAATVAELAAALDSTPLPGARAFIEIPPGALTAEVLRVVADHRYLVKLRTGGVTAAAFPDEPTLAGCLTALADERLPFKCTAGLHHAVRHTADDTGFEHHGFLNVLLGVAAAVDGASAEQVARILADRDAASVAGAIAGLDAEAAAAARGLFTSFGTCSTDEPVTDLVTLGLVSNG
jgi:hypothetical protein